MPPKVLTYPAWFCDRHWGDKGMKIRALTSKRPQPLRETSPRHESLHDRVMEAVLVDFWVKCPESSEEEEATALR